MSALVRTTPPLGDGMMILVLVVVLVVGVITARTIVAGEECRMSRGVRATRTIADPTLAMILAAAIPILVAGTTTVVVWALAMPATITLSRKSEAMRMHRSIVQIIGVAHRRQPL